MRGRRSVLSSLRREPSGDRIPNLAPMVDVIMVLLVFFMLGASLQITRESALGTELDPRSGPGGGAAIEIVSSVKIAIEHQDAAPGFRLFVQGREVEGNTFAALEQFMHERRLAGADPTNPVIVGAQGGVRWKFVVAAMDAAIRAGYRDVQFAVRLGG